MKPFAAPYSPVHDRLAIIVSLRDANVIKSMIVNIFKCGISHWEKSNTRYWFALQNNQPLFPFKPVVGILGAYTSQLSSYLLPLFNILYEYAFKTSARKSRVIFQRPIFFFHHIIDFICVVVIRRRTYEHGSSNYIREKFHAVPSPSLWIRWLTNIRQ